MLQRTSDKGEAMMVATDTELPSKFVELDDTFVSLGQDDDFYKKLHEALGDRAGEVLDALRDIAWRPAFASDFEPTPAFRNAMMRENGAQRARRFGRAWALGEQITERPAFDYVGTIEGLISRSKASSTSAQLIRCLVASSALSGATQSERPAT